MNQIFLDNIRAEAQVGIYPHELTGSQPLILSLCLDIDGRAARSDRIEDTICYAELLDSVRTLLSRRRFALLEHLAEQLTEMIFTRFAPAAIELSVYKPAVLPAVDRVGIRIRRSLSAHATRPAATEAACA